MGSDDKSSTGDPTAWASLTKLAQSGKLTVDEKVVESCVAAVLTLIQDMRGIKKAITDGKLDGLDRFAQPESAIELVRIFSEKAVEVGDVLDDHIRVLTDMGDTLMAAAKSYKTTHQKSQEDFARITKDVASINTVPVRPDDPKYKPPLPMGIADVKNTFDSFTVIAKNMETLDLQPEPGDSRGWNELHGLYTDTNAMRALDAGGNWRWLAAHLQNRSRAFAATMKSSKKLWEGDGAKAARDVATAHTKSIDGLRTVMDVLGRNLVGTSTWLRVTRYAMPDQLNPAVKTSKNLVAYRRNYANTYVVGFNQSAQRVPVVVSPIPPRTTPPPGTDGDSGGGSGLGDKLKNLLDDLNSQNSDLNGLDGIDASGLDTAGLGGTAFDTAGFDGPGLGAGSSEVGAAPPLPPFPDLPAGLDGSMPDGGAGVPDIGLGGPDFGLGGPEPGLGGSGPGLGGSLPGLGGSTPGLPGGASANPNSANTPGASPGANPLSSNLLSQARNPQGGDPSAAARQAGMPRSATGGPGPGPGRGPGAPGPIKANDAAQAAKLFPRASLPGIEAGVRPGVPGVPGAGGMGPMMPGMPGAGAAGAQGQGREHKRAKNLDSKKHLDKALGPIPDRVKPVIEP